MLQTERLLVKALVGKYPHTAALLSHDVASARIAFDFSPIEPVFRGFKAMIERQAFDICEMAPATFLMAFDRGAPLTLIPATLLARLQHPTLICRSDSFIRGPSDLVGKRVALRSYTQTSGVWIRGILAMDFGVKPDQIEWLTLEDGHIGSYRDPVWTRRVTSGASIAQLLESGEADAAIAELPASERRRTVFADPELAAHEWSQRLDVRPANHMAVIRTTLIEQHPWLPAEIIRILAESRLHAPSGASSAELLPFGIDENRSALALLADFAFSQGLVSRRYEPAEMVGGHSWTDPR